MMLYPAMNELLAQVPSRYQLVNVVAARARKIASQAERSEEMLEDKPVSIAIREIAQGEVLEGGETEESFSGFSQDSEGAFQAPAAGETLEEPSPPAEE